MTMTHAKRCASLTVVFSISVLARAAYAEDARPALPGFTDPPPPPDPRAPPKFKLETGGESVSLYRLDDISRNGDGNRGWTRLCDAPCNRNDVPDGTFLVRGDGVTTSRSFALNGKEPTTTVHVTPGSRALWWTAGGLGVAGTLALPTSIVMIAVGNDHNQLRTPGFFTMGGAFLALIAAGVIGYVARTDVSVETPPKKELGARLRLTPSGLVF